MKTQNLLRPIFGMAIIAVLLSTMSCDSANPSALVGHWLHESGSTSENPEDLELFKDGTGMCDGATISWKVENKRLALLSSQRGYSFDYEVSGPRLTLSDNNEKITYVNINDKSYQKKGNFTDSRDGKKYGTTKIGEQTWMAENLNYESEGSKCYDNDPANCQKYGRLYDWNTAINVCPKGWHLPSKDEWQKLTDFFGDKAGKKLKAVSGWNSDNKEKSSNGTDIYGFSALPGGYGYSGGRFDDAGSYGGWWSASEDDSYRDMGYSIVRTLWDDKVKSYSFSVRCVQD